MTQIPDKMVSENFPELQFVIYAKKEPFHASSLQTRARPFCQSTSKIEKIKKNKNPQFFRFDDLSCHSPRGDAKKKKNKKQ